MDTIPVKRKAIVFTLSIMFGGLLVIGGGVFLLVYYLAIKTQVTGSLIVDGVPVSISRCRSGEVFGFSGIEMMDTAGLRLRWITNPINEEASTVVLFPAGQKAGIDLGSCVRLSMRPTSSRVNFIINRTGHAELTCKTSGHTVSGTVDFVNCH